MKYAHVEALKGSITVTPNKKVTDKNAFILKEGQTRDFADFAEYSSYVENLRALEAVSVLKVHIEPNIATEEEIMKSNAAKSKKMDDGVTSPAEQKLIDQERIAEEKKKAEAAAMELEVQQSQKEKAADPEKKAAKPESKDESAPAKPLKKKPKKSREQALAELETGK